MESSERQRLIEKIQPLFVSSDDFYINSGLDFWFTPHKRPANSFSRPTGI